MTRGTREWADLNVNIYSGCSNDCKYCYAKAKAIRYGRKTAETWPEMVLNAKSLGKEYRKIEGRTMFPSTHDITGETVGNCIAVLTRLLEAGNEVLVTTKPDPAVVRKLRRALKCFNNRVQFRFTITSADRETLAFWEPGAPVFEQRLEALADTFQNGWKTSISVEPWLGAPSDTVDLVKKLQPYVTESIWLGPANPRYCPAELWREDWWGKEAMQELKTLLENDNGIIRALIRYKDAFAAGVL